MTPVLSFVLRLLWVLFVHWYANFECQTDWQALNKWTNWKALLGHTATYSAYMLALVPTWSIPATLWFGLVTFLCHTATDAVTSRLSHRLWEAGETHYFFVVIGFDQWLHVVQLALTFYWLTR